MSCGKIFALALLLPIGLGGCTTYGAYTYGYTPGYYAVYPNGYTYQYPPFYAPNYNAYFNPNPSGGGANS